MFNRTQTPATSPCTNLLVESPAALLDPQAVIGTLLMRAKKKRRLVWAAAVSLTLSN